MTPPRWQPFSEKEGICDLLAANTHRAGAGCTVPVKGILLYSRTCSPQGNHLMCQTRGIKKYVSKCGFFSLIALASKCRRNLTCINAIRWIQLPNNHSVVLQNSSALLNSSSFCFSLFRQPWLTVGIRPLAWSHLSEKPLRLLDWGFWAGLGLPGGGQRWFWNTDHWSVPWLDQHRKWDSSRRSPVETGFQP